jgi:hypothetical protein
MLSRIFVYAVLCMYVCCLVHDRMYVCFDTYISLGMFRHVYVLLGMFRCVCDVLFSYWYVSLGMYVSLGTYVSFAMFLYNARDASMTQPVFALSRTCVICDNSPGKEQKLSKKQNWRRSKTGEEAKLEKKQHRGHVL